MSKEKDRDRENHQGSIAAEDIELTEWLDRLWSRSEFPERIELWQTFGKYKATRGEMIHHEDFKNEKLNVEQANKIANELLAAAQNDTDGRGKESSYQLLVIDRNRKANPLVRLIGPIAPKRKLSIATAGVSGYGESEGGDDEDTDQKSLNYQYSKDNMAQVRWDKTRYDTCLGHILSLYDHQVKTLQEHNMRLMEQSVSMFDKLQESKDRELDRELIREREKFKADLMKEGMLTARNLLPGLFARAGGGEQQQQMATTSPTENGEPKTFGMFPERQLVGNFLRDCENAGISIALFGNYEEADGKAVQTTPGIFSPRQFSVLYGVYEGRLPATALDNLMPGSGHKDEVTQELIVQAQKAGVTDGIGMALFEIVGLRQRAKESMRANTNGTQEESSL